MTNGKETIFSSEKRFTKNGANQHIRQLVAKGWIAYSCIKSHNITAFKGDENYKAATFFFWSGGSVTVILTKYQREV